MDSMAEEQGLEYRGLFMLWSVGSLPLGDLLQLSGDLIDPLRARTALPNINGSGRGPWWPLIGEKEMGLQL